MIKITVGTATCGNAAGAQGTLHKLIELSKNNSDVNVSETGCIGLCAKEPIVEVYADNKRYMYGGVNEKIAELIYKEHIDNNKPFEKFLIGTTTGDYGDSDVFKNQTRIVLRNVGTIDPEKLDDYLARDGYKGLKKALEMTPDEIINTIKESGLRGRGGAGFLTGLKWQLAKNEVNDKKYIVCNADEGDPGAFMDRSVLEGDPHSVIEGMLICGYAIGADEGYIYCRAEYPLAIKRLKIAIEDATKNGFLGNNILNKGFNFELHIKEGAGAFVCGEETALMASIEGRRGMPRIRPPFPSKSGIWDKPTNINNVETFANVAWIILHGAGEYNKYGYNKSRGTKVFALAGKIKNGGLIEVEMGMTLRQVIFDIGGGILNNKKFKAVQMGGPSGGCIPESLIDTKVDYEELSATGAIVGSGGMVVVDENTCMVDMAKYFLKFTQNESCGKCTFCRIGTKRMLEILERISQGKGKMEDLDILNDLAYKIKNTSLCGLGQTAPNPVLTTLKYFNDEYIAHIKDKKCPAGACTALISFDIIAEKCTGCGACKKACPVNAISGEIKKVHTLDKVKCIKCGACYAACKFDAILKQ
jgi:NADH-quinone oxidoreductase subunit F